MPSKDDIKFMAQAINLALKSKGKVSPNPVVGAVIVKSGKVISTGYHKVFGGPHAEVNAITSSKVPVAGATLYVTLEPCCHFGKTPPCVDLIIKNKIKKVVIGGRDPNPRIRGRSIKKLQIAGVEVVEGVLEQETKKINEDFIKFISKKMPFVAAKSACSLDGKIATSAGHSKWITSEASREYARNIRNQFDAILVGVNTIIKDDPTLDPSLKSKVLKKVIVDSKLSISVTAAILNNQNKDKCIIATTKYADKARLKFLKDHNIDFIICPDKENKVDLKSLFKELAKRNISSILIEGGAKIIGSALKEHLVDKMYFYIAPKIVGDQQALSSIDGLNIKNVNKCINFKDMEVKLIGKDIMVEAYVLRNS